MALLGKIIPSIWEIFFENDMFLNENSYDEVAIFCLREDHKQHMWLDEYSDLHFYRFFRMTRETTHLLLRTMLENDRFHFMEAKYTGGNVPVDSYKSVLIFVYYMAHEDCLRSISTRFSVSDSTVMNICNNLLFILLSIKHKYIFWPKNEEEYNYIIEGFNDYPGVVGAIDGCHIKIKVPDLQHDSYVDRYMQHSLNLMAICTAEKIFTYIFVGFPGAAHDARVFANSELFLAIEEGNKHLYFPREEYHLLGDEAFPLKTWLMKPYRRRQHMPLRERVHNRKLSSNRVCIENTFGIVKSRWRRLQFVNTYSIAKAIEIVACACILHNFTYMNNEPWNEEIEINQPYDEDYYDEDNRQQLQLAQMKRDHIAEILNN